MLIMESLELSSGTGKMVKREIFHRCSALMVCFSSGSLCWYFSHEPSSLFHHSVLVDLSVSMMMH